MAKNTALWTTFFGVGVTGMLAIWLASTQAEACLRSPSYLIPFLISSAFAVAGVAMLLRGGRRATRYGRLKRLYKQGQRLQREIDGDAPGSSDLILRLAWELNEASKWTIAVDEELENIAPEHLREWSERVGPIDRAPVPEMARRLAILGGIMDRIRAKDGGA